jgi:hypothetical protein
MRSQELVTLIASLSQEEQAAVEEFIRYLKDNSQPAELPHLSGYATNARTLPREPACLRRIYGVLRSSLERDLGGVAEGVEHAEEKIGRDVLGVAVHDGGDAGAGSAGQTSDLDKEERITESARLLLQQPGGECCPS